MSASDVVVHTDLNVATTSVHSHALNAEEDTVDVADVDFVIDEEIPLDAKHLNRVHEELEKLNIATDVINKLELQLDEARATFRQIQASWSQKLNELSKKYGSAIEKGRPYYEAKLEERRLREEAQNAAIRFERANSMHAVAKQQVKLTQDSLNRQKIIEPECLEVLNHHIQRVNEAEAERLAAEELHRNVSARMVETTLRIARIQKENARAIKKSRQYFEQRVEFTRILEQQKSLIVRLEAEVRQKKFDYTTSLRNLEQISDAIHEERSLTMECDKTIDPSMFVDELAAEGVEERESRPVSLGSGVILLAQQLMRSHDKNTVKQNTPIKLSSDISDFRYQTALPEGVALCGMPSCSSDNSDSESSLGSNRTEGTIGTDDLCGMLRSHSMLMQEIDECAQRAENILQNGASDGERGSASGDSSAGY
ncbi:SH3 domain-binding protein 5-like [Toxocara canis]|uniref:SH3 domain-binding protein 5-like n=1 Tax=Toxocara canis TaxID=6265 RepID=A0A0B2VRD6_TOXCA|nr:SH3 domain-binding protein 5-like [Toxocara canis]